MVARDALVRIEGGAYANLVLPALLERSGLSPEDRRFVTELVYGTTRMRRACDWLVDRFLVHDPDPPTRAVLRLGAFQLVFLKTPPHAAVSATVSAAPGRTRGLANAVLRRVASAGLPDPDLPGDWPGEAVRLSYPDWVVERLVADLGGADAWEALRVMNQPATATTRPDGYVQDDASRWVAEAVGGRPGERVADLCAGPGGKATAIAADGATVAACDVRPARARLVAANARRLGARSLAVVVADATVPPFRAGAFDRVLVDAPCSGLGVLRRRPDARWRVGPDDVAALAELQRRLLAAAATLVRPGGLLVYSVCTLARAETLDVDAWAAHRLAAFEAVTPPAAPWQPAGRGARLLPQSADTDGMFVLLLRRPGGPPVAADGP